MAKRYNNYGRKIDEMEDSSGESDLKIFSVVGKES